MAITGYVPGAFDLFHIGHLRILERAAEHCDYLIAGVVSDEVATIQKGRPPFVPEAERVEIVRGLKVVDDVHVETTTDKLATWEQVRFDVVFKGSDWVGSPKWVHLEKEFAARGVRVQYLPYTEHISSTFIRSILEKVDRGDVAAISVPLHRDVMMAYAERGAFDDR